MELFIFNLNFFFLRRELKYSFLFLFFFLRQSTKHPCQSSLTKQYTESGLIISEITAVFIATTRQEEGINDLTIEIITYKITIKCPFYLINSMLVPINQYRKTKTSIFTRVLWQE